MTTETLVIQDHAAGTLSSLQIREDAAESMLMTTDVPVILAGVGAEICVVSGVISSATDAELEFLLTGTPWPVWLCFVLMTSPVATAFAMAITEHIREQL